jgi:hypothetical protein
MVALTGMHAKGHRSVGRRGGRVAGAVAAVVVGLAGAGPARAADVTIAPGDEFTLTGNLVLEGGDVFKAGAPGGARCRIHGGGFEIRTKTTMLVDGVPDEPWTGKLTIDDCDLDGLGQPAQFGDDVDAKPLQYAVPAVELFGPGDVSVRGATFSKSGQLSLRLRGAMNVTFQHNTIAEDSIVPTVTVLSNSLPSFYATGESTGTKLFQGNRVLHGQLHFETTSGWTIGGAGADGNVLAGVRAGMFLDRVDGFVVRGNYTRTSWGQILKINGEDRGWNQVKDMSILSPGAHNLIEHNVFRGYNWVLETTGAGDIQYNLFVDAVERAWVQVDHVSGAHIHHNIMLNTKSDQFVTVRAGFDVIGTPTDPAPSAEIYNNTLDAGGVCNPAMDAAVGLRFVLKSLRSNALVGFRLPPYANGDLVRMVSDDYKLPPVIPPLLESADYNLFYNVDPTVLRNYGTAVDGKTERVDDGFGLHDVPVGGAANAQAEPKFAGMGGLVPRVFPFDEAGLIAGTTTACQVLAYYRRVYAPGAGSPLIDAGDPAEGPGNDIGAVGAGADNPLDLFGKLCDPNDVGTPLDTPDVYKCPKVSLQRSGGGGGPTTTTSQLPPGITCVCDAGAGVPHPAAAVLPILGLALVTMTRRRRA